MRNIGKSGMIAGLFALVLAVCGAALLINSAVADEKKKNDKRVGEYGLTNAALGF
jgi:hypothetical protein